MNLATSYAFLILAVILGVTSNSFAKTAEGFTLLFPSIITAITIVACMYALIYGDEKYSNGNYLCFICRIKLLTVIVGVIRFNCQIVIQ
jgi:small multidrug resistance pump